MCKFANEYIDSSEIHLFFLSLVEKLRNEQNVKECDATDDDRCTKAGYIVSLNFLKNFSPYPLRVGVNCILRPVHWMQYFFDKIFYNTIARKPTMIANNAAPSTRAAVRIMLARMSFDASG